MRGYSNLGKSTKNLPMKLNDLIFNITRLKADDRLILTLNYKDQKKTISLENIKSSDLVKRAPLNQSHPERGGFGCIS